MNDITTYAAAVNIFVSFFAYLFSATDGALLVPQSISEHTQSAERQMQQKADLAENILQAIAKQKKAYKNKQKNASDAQKQASQNVRLQNAENGAEMQVKRAKRETWNVGKNREGNFGFNSYRSTRKLRRNQKQKNKEAMIDDYANIDARKKQTDSAKKDATTSMQDNGNSFLQQNRNRRYKRQNDLNTTKQNIRKTSEEEKAEIEQEIRQDLKEKERRDRWMAGMPTEREKKIRNDMAKKTGDKTTTDVIHEIVQLEDGEEHVPASLDDISYNKIAELDEYDVKEMYKIAVR